MPDQVEKSRVIIEGLKLDTPKELYQIRANAQVYRYAAGIIINPPEGRRSQLTFRGHWNDEAFDDDYTTRMRMWGNIFDVQIEPEDPEAYRKILIVRALLTEDGNRFFGLRFFGTGFIGATNLEMYKQFVAVNFRGRAKKPYDFNAHWDRIGRDSGA
jgi:hypothetical protein